MPTAQRSPSGLEWGRYDQVQAMPKAEIAARQALALDDSLAEAHASLAGVLYEAIAAFEKGTDPARPFPWLGLAYCAGGRVAEARAVLAAMRERAKTEYVSPQDFATIHLGLGEREEVFRLLEEAYEQRAIAVRDFTEGLFLFLRDDPKFQDLLRRMGLADLKQFKPSKRS
jgi:tetratricopeptide (TPR) repeat protein